MLGLPRPWRVIHSFFIVMFSLSLHFPCLPARFLVFRLKQGSPDPFRKNIDSALHLFSRKWQETFRHLSFLTAEQPPFLIKKCLPQTVETGARISEYFFTLPNPETAPGRWKSSISASPAHTPRRRIPPACPGRAGIAARCSGPGRCGPGECPPYTAFYPSR